MLMQAHAKINLALDVIAKRDDGYHELDMIMLPLPIYDVLKVTISDQDEIKGLDVPLKSNTIFKAIQVTRDAFGFKAHFQVEVEKNIPMQAGLAGGSADAAAMMKAILALCDIDADEETCLRLAKRIGADVPFCFVNEMARVQGIGEKVRRIEHHCPFYLFLVKPKEGVSTKEAFARIDFQTCMHPDVEAAQCALKEGDYVKLCQVIGNTLEASAFEITPIIRTIKQELAIFGFDTIVMSGSGSTVFALTRNQNILNNAMNTMKDQYPFTYACLIE